jgi:phosphocarrier protein HPr
MTQNFPVSRRQVGVSIVHGLHLRAASKFVKLAKTFQSEVRVHCNGVIANGKSILDLLSLAAECGTMLALEVQGCDAEDAVAALADLILGQSSDSEDQPKEAAC